MFLQNTTRKISKIYHEYPRTFWNVVVISFIDHIGGALIFPFFALYLTSKFNVGMTQVLELYPRWRFLAWRGLMGVSPSQKCWLMHRCLLKLLNPV